MVILEVGKRWMTYDGQLFPLDAVLSSPRRDGINVVLSEPFPDDGRLASEGFEERLRWVAGVD
jgi:hypothetical protein